MSVLLIDDVSELAYNNAKKLNIEYFCMPIEVDGQRISYDMGHDFDYDRFYSSYRKGINIESKDMSVEDYIDIFEQYLKINEDILYLHHSDKLNNYFDCITEAISRLKEQYPERSITLVDTENVSMGYGVIAYEAGILHKRGATDTEIMEYVDSIKGKIATYAIVDDVNTLKDNKKLTASQNVVGSKLGVKSILAITMNGTIEIAEKYASKKKAVLRLYDKLRQEGVNLKDFPIGISYVDDKENAEMLRDKILEVVGEDAMVWLQPMSPIVALQLGQGAIVLSYHVSKKKY
jgi:DegV family protein with EDD domain